MTAPAAAPVTGARPSNTSTRLWRAGAIALAVLLLGELGARALAPHLPPISLGDAAEMQLKLDRMDTLATGPHTDVAILGNSMADRGIDPAVMTATRPDLGRVYNAALVGAPLRGEARWAERFVLDRLRPGTVVLAMSPVDMLAIDPIATLTGRRTGTAEIAAIEAQFTDALDRLDPGPLQRIDDRISDASALVANRASLRHPDAVIHAASDLATGKPPREGLARVGLENGKLVPRDERYWRASLTPEGHARELELRQIQATPDACTRAVVADILGTDQLQRATFRDLLDKVGGDGRRVVVALIPAATRWLDRNGIDRRGLTAAGAAVAAQARAAGVDVVDLTGAAYPETAYTDLVHLNARGVASFSADLARQL